MSAFFFDWLGNGSLACLLTLFHLVCSFVNNPLNTPQWAQWLLAHSRFCTVNVAFGCKNEWIKIQRAVKLKIFHHNRAKPARTCELVHFGEVGGGYLYSLVVGHTSQSWEKSQNFYSGIIERTIIKNTRSPFSSYIINSNTVQWLYWYPVKHAF